ncbi:MAG: PEP-CTERM sorting domain-containing protein [Burkholderiaceae bacterium]|nr:PEP-CTERM sorting domain-containing protein [Burkholderiaceae bacterium]
MKKFICLLGWMLTGIVNAATVDIYVGDNDGYGIGIADNGVTGAFSFTTDNRSLTELGATNGAQQTDFYSALFSPLPATFDVVFSLTENLVWATFEVDVADLQASQLGQFSVLFNGVLKASIFNFQDGFGNSAIHSFSLDANDLSNANTSNEFVVTFNRNGSNDAVAFDYFRLTGETQSLSVQTRALAVPEPRSIVLLGLGLASLAFARRRSQA